MNAINEYINFEKSNIILFAKEVLSEYYDEEMFEKLLTTYVESRYYNYNNFCKKTLSEDIFGELKKTLTRLVEGTDKDTKKKLKEMYVIFYYVMIFDGVIDVDEKKLVSLLCSYRLELFDLEDMIFKENMFKLLANVARKRKEFFSTFKCEDFEINRSSTSNINITDIVLRHRINFPKIYSEYAVDRVFNTGIINEDKTMVLYYLTSYYIMKDIKDCEFDDYYLLDFPCSLFENRDKLETLLEIVDNDIFRNQTIFKISYDDYGKYINNVKDMMREGYKFALIANDEELKDNNLVLTTIFEYIIVDKDSAHLNESDKMIYIK